MHGLVVAALTVAALGLAGCGTVPAQPGTAQESTEPASARSDPWERLNRRIFDFNEVVDAAVIKPVALGYRAVVPEWLRTGVDNMFGNLGDAWSAVNLVLQAKPKVALEVGMRVVTNTLFGLFGFLDIADEMGLPRQSEDFGQTLGVWGVGSGPYLVLPLLGPSTLRDTAALPVDFKASPSALAFNEVRDQNGATVLQVINTRVKLLNATRVLDDVALDKYILLRDAYLARRRNQVYDGDPPEEQDTKAAEPPPAEPKPAEPKPAK
ncbi:VacJ family lipoprotein [Aquincola sp. S2]|uniref:VacJ family lipoprotein n=2 Tax=Pseudaquabacterium terrae TaxID=2732868 RepID=A0ABX2EDR3_9BURK|nr:VacJ family lipoprotein [Aquabacterium terrae]NRF66617.1 VacJ family lipoprotein [Aquabacterium terrae]